MKVIIIINNLGVGGAERLVIDDINEMLRRDIDVTLVTLSKENTSRSLSYESHLGDKNWKVIEFRSLFDIRSWIKIVNFIQKNNPDIIFTHLWYANMIGRIGGVLAGAKNIVTYEHNVYTNLKSRKMFFVDRVLQFFSSTIIAVSEPVRESLIKHGINSKKIIVIHNAVDRSKYSGILPSSIRKDLNIEKEFIYIFIGRLIEQKAVDVLLRAFKEISEGVLLLAGDGILKDHLTLLSKSLGIKKRVFFLGIRNDIPNLLRSSDCFVLPSRYEGLPVALLEALSVGKAIIISDFPSGREIIKHNVNGLVFKRDDVHELAQNMILIKGDKNLRKRFEQKAFENAGDFSINKHVDKLLSLVNI